MLYIQILWENEHWYFGLLNKEMFRQSTYHVGIVLYGESGKDFRVAVAKIRS